MIPYYQSIYQEYKKEQERLVQEKIQKYAKKCELELSKSLHVALKDCLIASSLAIQHDSVNNVPSKGPSQTFQEDDDVFVLDEFQNVTEKYSQSDEEDFVMEIKETIPSSIQLSTSLPISIPTFGLDSSLESHDEFVAPHILSSKTYAGDPLKHLRPNKALFPE
jgi:hypothetical protein